MKHGLAGVIVAFATASACASKQPTAPAVVGSSPGVAPVARIERRVDDLSLLPVQAELVMGFDLRRMQASVLWKDLVEPQLAKASLDAYKATCGFNPFASVTTATMAVNGLGDTPTSMTGVIVVHGLDRAKTLACVDAMAAHPAKNGQHLTRRGEVIVSDDSSGIAVTMRFVRADTLVVTIGAAPAAGMSLRSSPAFVAMLDTIDTTRTIWLLARGDSKAFAAVAQSGYQLKAVFGSVDVTDRVTVVGRARFDSAATATQLATTLTTELDAVKGFVDKLDIATDGADLTVDAAASVEKLKMLASIFNGLSSSTGP